MSEKRFGGQVPGDDALREQLSAFMDGELDADRARFLIQRLRHDDALRAQWERWQLQSSAMRRQAQPLPADFADRVAGALDADAVNAVPVRNRPLRWAGGAALAASLVVAGVFVFDAAHAPQTHAPQVAQTKAVARPVIPAAPATNPSNPMPDRALAVAAPGSLAASPAQVARIERASRPMPEPKLAAAPVEAPRIELPIPVHDGVVGAFRSPLRPMWVHRNRPAPQFSPFPQPLAIDPELAAYLEQQKSGNDRDPFARRHANFPATGDDSVRPVDYPQDEKH